MTDTLAIILAVVAVIIALLLLLAALAFFVEGNVSAGGVSLVFTLLAVFGAYSLLNNRPALRLNTVPSDIIFAGKVVNPQTHKWPDDRLVIVFQDDHEVGRGLTHLGEFPGGNLGVINGYYQVKIKNIYKLTLRQLNEAANNGQAFGLKEEGGFLGFGRVSYAYTWINETLEGSTISLPVKLKNITYVIKVLEGDARNLPVALIGGGAAKLAEDQTILVDVDPNLELMDSNMALTPELREIAYAAGEETVVVNKVTVPLDNCKGNAPIHQHYTETQTYVHEIKGEVQAGASLKIPGNIWSVLVPEVQAKLGFQNGQVNTKTVEYDMTANANSNVVYVITWQEVWDKGEGHISLGLENFLVPFRAKTNLIYSVDSQNIPCQ